MVMGSEASTRGTKQPGASDREEKAMTTASAGTHKFHLKPVMSVLAATTIVAATIVVAQQLGRDTPQSAPEPIEAATAAVVPYAASNGLAEALADGKLDAGFVSPPSQPASGSSSVPETYTIVGQGGLYHALIDGKFASDWQSRDSGVQYVSGGEAPAIAGGLWAALESGKLDAGLGESESATQPAPTSSYAQTVSGGHQE